MPFQRRGQGPVIVGSPDPLAWANKADGAKHAWDFIANAARWNGQYIGALANTPNWTFTRASTGYAQTAAGVLVPFASGELRRTDKGVLIEGAGTNLCLQSQTFDNASWGKTNVTVTVDQVAAPDGTLTADKVTSAAAAGRLTQNITLTAAATYAFSIFLLGGTSAQSTLEVADLVGGDTQAQLVITWTAGVPSTSSSTGASSITYSALAGGWYRVSFTFAADAVNTNHQFQVKPDTAAGANYIYGWGAQVE